MICDGRNSCILPGLEIDILIAIDDMTYKRIYMWCHVGGQSGDQGRSRWGLVGDGCGFRKYPRKIRSGNLAQGAGKPGWNISPCARRTACCRGSEGRDSRWPLQGQDFFPRYTPRRFGPWKGSLWPGPEGGKSKQPQANAQLEFRKKNQHPVWCH